MYLWLEQGQLPPPFAHFINSLRLICCILWETFYAELKEHPWLTFEVEYEGKMHLFEMHIHLY